MIWLTRDARLGVLEGARSVFPTLIGLVPFALVVGVAGTGAGLTAFETIGLSLIVFSGIAQLVISQLLAADSPWPVILATTVVLSLRFLMYSAALAPYLGGLPQRWKLAIGYTLTDQGFAADISHFQRGPHTDDGRWFCIGAGLVQWIPWQVGVAVGALVGAQIPKAWALDCAVPLSFLAMLVPALRDRASLAAAVTAAVVALGALGLPLKLGLITAALAGIGTGYLVGLRGAAR